MTFNEYLASFITPQMTLLEKFNALLEFLNKYALGTKLYKHTIECETPSEHKRRIEIINTSYEKISTNENSIKDAILTSIKTTLFDIDDEEDIEVIQFDKVELDGDDIVFSMNGNGVSLLEYFNSDIVSII